MLPLQCLQCYLSAHLVRRIILNHSYLEITERTEGDTKDVNKNGKTQMMECSNVPVGKNKALNIFKLTLPFCHVPSWLPGEPETPV